MEFLPSMLFTSIIMYQLKHEFSRFHNTEQIKMLSFIQLPALFTMLCPLSDSMEILSQSWIMRI